MNEIRLSSLEKKVKYNPHPGFLLMLSGANNVDIIPARFFKLSNFLSYAAKFCRQGYQSLT